MFTDPSFVVAMVGRRKMIHWKRGLILWAVLTSGLIVPAAFAEQLNPQQIQIIQDTAASICDTIKEVKGQKSNFQIQGDVKAQLGGLVGKLVDVGGTGKGSLTRDEFEGLSQDATAAALKGDQGCRERVFNKMFDKLSMEAKQPPGAFSEEVNALSAGVELLSNRFTAGYSALAADRAARDQLDLIGDNGKGQRQTGSQRARLKVRMPQVACYPRRSPRKMAFRAVYTGSAPPRPRFRALSSCATR
jgi:hypothetical protein